MKVYATLAAAAVLVTSPISATAQTSSEYEHCISGCNDQMQAARDYCNARYGEGSWWIIDRDWCEYDAGRQAEQCYDFCAQQYPQMSAYEGPAQRFRPVSIDAQVQVIT